MLGASLISMYFSTHQLWNLLRLPGSTRRNLEPLPFVTRPITRTTIPTSTCGKAGCAEKGDVSSFLSGGRTFKFSGIRYFAGIELLVVGLFEDLEGFVDEEALCRLDFGVNGAFGALGCLQSQSTTSVPSSTGNGEGYQYTSNRKSHVERTLQPCHIIKVIYPNNHAH